MALTLVRVDDRLIHGQVIAVWLRARGAHRIIIVDDDTAADDFLAEVLILAAPPGVEVEVYDETDAVERLIELAAATEKVFVVMRSPEVALRLVEDGVPIPVLNIGGIGASPERAPLYKNIAASPAEIEAMKSLEAKGTRVEIQIVADDTPVPIASVLSGKK